MPPKEGGGRGRGRGRGNGGKGRGGGGGGGGGGGRGRGRGRGGPAPPGFSPAQPSPSTAQPSTLERRDSEVSQGGPSCLLCTEPITYFAIGDCGHNSVCMLCTVRLRRLYSDKACPMCKTTQLSVLLTTDENATNTPQGLVGKRLESSISAYFDSPAVQREYESIIQPACPEDDCDFRCSTIPDIKKHVAQVHQRYFCDICLGGSMKFITEQELYSRAELLTHMKEGDRQSGLKPHPTCEFCHDKWYDNDTLYHHLRQDHFQCVCCAGDNNFVFFETVASMRAHYNESHYPCMHENCYDQVHIVFKTEEALKTHMVQEHGSTKMPRFQRDSARPVQTSFNIRRQGHGGGGIDDTIDDGRGSYRRGGNSGGADRRGRGNKRGGTQLEGQQYGRFGTDDDEHDRTSGAGSNSDKSKGKDKGKGKGKGKARAEQATSAHQAVQSAIADNAGQSVLSKRGGNTLQEAAAVPANEDASTPQLSDADIAKSKQLVTILKRLLSPDHFKAFKKVSVQFRTGAISPAIYFKHLTSYFGDPVHWKEDGAREMFARLLDTLPDEAKKVELERVYKAESAKSHEFPSLPPSAGGGYAAQARQRAQNRVHLFKKNIRTVWQTGNSAPLAGGGGHSTSTSTVHDHAPSSPIHYATPTPATATAAASGSTLAGAAAYQGRTTQKPAWVHDGDTAGSVAKSERARQVEADEQLARQLAGEPGPGQQQQHTGSRNTSVPERTLDSEAFPALGGGARGGSGFPSLGLLDPSDSGHPERRAQQAMSSWRGGGGGVHEEPQGYYQSARPTPDDPHEVRRGKKGKKTKTVLLKIG